MGNAPDSGFITVAVAMVFKQLSGSHQILGAVIGVFTILQASAGSFIHNWSPAERKHHHLITVFHLLAGKALICVAVANMWLGELP